jgi:hypothetical protein
VHVQLADCKAALAEPRRQALAPGFGQDTRRQLEIDAEVVRVCFHQKSSPGQLSGAELDTRGATTPIPTPRSAAHEIA